MAGASWIAARFAAEANLSSDDGTAALWYQDIGTDIYDSCTLASLKAGVPLDKVEVAPAMSLPGQSRAVLATDLGPGRLWRS